MTDSEPENSACAWNSGLLMNAPEDIAAFDEAMRNVVITPLMIEMLEDLKEMQRAGDYSESENSACTWSLGNVRICGEEDVAAFEESMKNPDESPERIAFFREAIDVYDRCFRGGLK